MLAISNEVSIIVVSGSLKACSVPDLSGDGAGFCFCATKRKGLSKQVADQKVRISSGEWNKQKGMMKRFMRKLLLYASALWCMLAGGTCRDNVITVIDETKPGRRDYEWFVDTLTAGGNIMNSIDGISPTDVWVTSIPGDFTQTLYHFDGAAWKTDGVNRPLSPWSVYPLSPNNVWSVADEGEIWSYDGMNWRRNTKIVIAGNPYIDFYDVTGTASNLFAVGSYSPGGTLFYSLIYHYNGSQWSRIQLGQDLPVQLYRIRSFPSGGKYLILGTRGQQNLQELDTSKIFEFDGQSLKEIYSAVEGRHGYGFFEPVSNGMIISRGTKISFSDGTSERVLVDVASNLFWNGFDARSEKDIVLAMLDGIAHYNGTDIEYLYKFSGNRVHIGGIKIFEKCVYVIAFDYDQNLNYVFRGYLKQ